MEFLDLLWYFYQYAMYLLTITAGEWGKIGRFYNEFLLLMTFLTVRGIRITKWKMALAYLVVVIVAIFIGGFLQSIGTAKISNTIANKQNPQMQEILERLTRIEENQK